MADTRYVNMYLSGEMVPRCTGCGVLVGGTDGILEHDKWHDRQGRVADDARWGGMNRPIGGGKLH